MALRLKTAILVLGREVGRELFLNFQGGAKGLCRQLVPARVIPDAAETGLTLGQVATVFRLAGEVIVQLLEDIAPGAEALLRLFGLDQEIPRLPQADVT